jgi:hypothetical protein
MPKINDMQVKSILAYVKSKPFGCDWRELTPLAQEIANEAIRRGLIEKDDQGFLRVK